MILQENIFYLIIAFGLVGLWFVYIKFPSLIRGKILETPNFNIEKIHIGNGIGVAFDFSNRTFVYSSIWNAYLFPASELINFRHHWLETPTNQGSIKETDQHLRIRLRNNNHPEIKAKFRTRSCAQRCENSFERLLGEEISYQESLLSEKNSALAQVLILNQNITPEHAQPPEPNYKIIDEPESKTTPKNADAMNLLITLLKDAGFSHDDAKGNDKRTVLNQTTDLIFSEYQKLIGHPLQHKGQQDIEKALLPFFERRAGEPKSIGFTAGTIKKYVSENKTAWEKKTKI